jgi:iron(III) transport system permease protein
MASASEAYGLKQKFSTFLGYGTVFLTLLILFFFLVYPVSLIISKAFIGTEGFTLQYFVLLFESSLQTTAISNSVLIGLATTVLATLVALPLSIMTTKFEFRFKGIFSALLLVPMIMPPFVGAIGIQRFFARMGSVNQFLMENQWISQPIDWLGESNQFWAVVILEVMHLYPIMYLNLSAALANVDPSLEEMAGILGANKFKQFKDIVWPLARPGFFAGAIITFIWALTDLGTPLLIGFHDTMPVRIFNLVTDSNQNPVGFALVFVVILMSVSFFLLSKFTMNGKKYEMMAKGHVTSGAKSAGTLEKIIIYTSILAVVTVSLIPHFGVIVTSLSDDWFMTVLPEKWTTHHYYDVLTNSLSYTGLKNSMLLASASTLFDVILGVLIAYVIQRKLIPYSNLLDSLVMVPLALPGIVLAFGYVVAFNDTFLDPLENPVPLLIIAYGIRRLPYMVRSASAGLQQMSISLEEASISFGASKFQTLRKITIPLVTANLIAGGLLCFSYAMLDVSDSLILAMKDRFYPLTKSIYVLFLEQGNGEFVASALGVIAMGILTLCILGASLILGKKMGELFRS